LTPPTLTPIAKVITSIGLVLIKVIIYKSVQFVIFL
jgi:hypothetical protein